MRKEDLNKILAKHEKWLNGEDDGCRADLSRADLSRANLSEADLSEANLSEADLSRADLSEVNLRGADLSGANIDYSSWPLWCGSLSVQIDNKQARQLIYHVYRAVAASSGVSEEIKSALFTEALTAEANKFHRVEECGKVAQPVSPEGKERDSNE